MRRNRKNDPNDIFGINELLDAWMDMMQVIPLVDSRTHQRDKPTVASKNNPMSYEDRDKDIFFTFDMPGVT